MFLPKTRDADIIVQEIGSELLIYDLKISKAYALNETLKIVYQACDGETSYEDLKRRHRQLTDDVIKLAVNELGREDLFVEKIDTVSRRRLLTRAMLATAALPIITIIVAPTPVSAASCIGGGSPCDLNNTNACCSKMCMTNDGSPICANVCLPAGNPCDLNNPSACCSTRCNINMGLPVCDVPCIQPNMPCDINNQAACCTRNCLVNAGKPVCASPN